MGPEADVLRHRDAKTQVLDLEGSTVIPGPNDSHTHPIRGGLNYNLELRWDGVPSLADALRLLRAQAQRTPPPHWVRVVAWFSGEDGRKGQIVPGQLADLAVLSRDYFSAPEEETKRLESVLTLVGGQVVHAAGRFVKLAPPDLPASLDWAPLPTRNVDLLARAARPWSGVAASAAVRDPLHCDCFVL